MRGLKMAIKRPWVVMIRPTELGSIPSPCLIKFRTGAIIEPAMIVKVAEARITHRLNLLMISMIVHTIFMASRLL